MHSAFLLKSKQHAVAATSLKKKKKQQLRFRILGDVAKEMTSFTTPQQRRLSQLVFGTLRLHETVEPFALLDETWRLGITAYDCAAVYGDGACERILGRWLRRPETDPAAREGAVIITKGGCGPATSGWAPRLDEESLSEELRRSLARLGRVDVYLLHRDDRTRPIGAIVEMMSRILSSGRVGSWGVSNWSVDRLAAALDYARSHGLAAPAYSSLQDSLAEPGREPWPGTVVMRDGDRKWYEAHKAEVTVLAWEAIGKGFLAGRWTEADAVPADDADSKDPARLDAAPMGDGAMAAWRDKRLRCAYLTADNFCRRQRAADLGARLARSLGPEHVALAWNIAQPYKSHVITATSSMEHLRSNVKALDLRLSPTLVNWLSTGHPTDQINHLVEEEKKTGADRHAAPPPQNI